MTRLARSDVFDPFVKSAYHCIQRCVRRSHLCGDDPLTGKNFDHRKLWLENRLAQLAGGFGIDVIGHSIMSNHFHLILRNRPDVVAKWSAVEVAVRWLSVGWRSKGKGNKPRKPSNAEISQIVNCPERLAEIRKRLSSISWFMKMIAEPIARMANAEDKQDGRFWRGRFRSVKLCDESAILACLAYIDLNPIRAGIASTPEESRFTSAWCRTQPRTQSDDANTHGASPDEWLAPVSLDENSSDDRATITSDGRATMSPDDRATTTSASGIEKCPQCSGIGFEAMHQDDPRMDCAECCQVEPTCDPTTDSPCNAVAGPSGEPGLPHSSRTGPASRCSDDGFLPMSLLDYLNLLDWTGRQVAPGKCGVISADAPPILQRLGIDAADWLTLATDFGRLFARVAGHPSSTSDQRYLRSAHRFRPGRAALFGTSPVPSR